MCLAKPVQDFWTPAMLAAPLKADSETGTKAAWNVQTGLALNGT